MVIRIPKYLKKTGIISTILFILFFLLVIIHYKPLIFLDKSINIFFLKKTFFLGNLLMKFISILGSSLACFIYILVLTFLLYFSNLRIPAFWLIITYISGIIFEQILKLIVSRRGPIENSKTMFSFPASKLFTSSMVIIIIFILVIQNFSSKKIRLLTSWGLLIFGILLIEASVYFQNNFLSDSLAGITLGISWITGWAELYRKYIKILLKKIPKLKKEII